MNSTCALVGLEKVLIQADNYTQERIIIMCKHSKVLLKVQTNKHFLNNCFIRYHNTLIKLHENGLTVKRI